MGSGNDTDTEAVNENCSTGKQADEQSVNILDGKKQNSLEYTASMYVMYTLWPLYHCLKNYFGFVAAAADVDDGACVSFG